MIQIVDSRGGRLVFRFSTGPAHQKIFFSKVEDPAKWEGLPRGLWCGTPPVARFVARWANRILRWWEKR